MSEYTAGEMLLRIKIEDTFTVEIKQRDSVTEMITNVKTDNSTLVTRLELGTLLFGANKNFVWEDDMRIVDEEVFRTCILRVPRVY